MSQYTAPTSFKDVAANQKAREATGWSAGLVAVMHSLERDIVMTNEDIVRKSEALRHDLDRAIDAITDNLNVNSLGIVQTSGVEIDRLCAKRQMLLEQAVAVHWAASVAE